MASLRIDLNGAGVSVGMFYIANQSAALNFDNFPSYVLISNLTNYTQWQSHFLDVLNEEQKNLVTFLEIE